MEKSSLINPTSKPQDSQKQPDSRSKSLQDLKERLKERFRLKRLLNMIDSNEEQSSPKEAQGEVMDQPLRPEDLH